MRMGGNIIQDSTKIKIRKKYINDSCHMMNIFFCKKYVNYFDINLLILLSLQSFKYSKIFQNNYIFIIYIIFKFLSLYLYYIFISFCIYNLYNMCNLFTFILFFAKLFFFYITNDSFLFKFKH